MSSANVQIASQPTTTPQFMEIPAEQEKKPQDISDCNPNVPGYRQCVSKVIIKGKTNLDFFGFLTQLETYKRPRDFPELTSAAVERVKNEIIAIVEVIPSTDLDSTDGLDKAQLKLELNKLTLPQLKALCLNIFKQIQVLHNPAQENGGPLKVRLDNALAIALQAR